MGFSLRGLDPSQMTDLGLVSLLSPLTLLVPLLLSLGFGLLLAGSRLDERLLFLYTLALIFFIHASPHLIYGTLRYSWAWKHLGVLDYIQRHGSVNPGIDVLGVYHNWPGFFALGTFFTDLGGFVNLYAFAGWAPVFFNSLYLLALLFLLKPMAVDRRLPWLAVWIFFLTNWVGQDYFSPQALSLFFYLLILGICLRYFVRLQSTPSIPSSRSILARLDNFFHRLDGYTQPVRSRVTDISQAQRVGLGTLLLLLFLAVVSTHQLTPFMTISAVLVLWFFRYLSWRNLPLLMILITVVWLILPASTFFFSNLGGLFESLGRLGENIGSNLQDLTLVSPGQITVALAGRL
jgi:hypothetical protein